MLLPPFNSATFQVVCTLMFRHNDCYGQKHSLETDQKLSQSWSPDHLNSEYGDWDYIYRNYPLGELPWKLGRPREILIRLIVNGTINVGKALDICCGAGTNAVY